MLYNITYWVGALLTPLPKVSYMFTHNFEFQPITNCYVINLFVGGEKVGVLTQSVNHLDAIVDIYVGTELAHKESIPIRPLIEANVPALAEWMYNLWFTHATKAIWA